MINKATALDRSQQLIQSAMRQGADGADAVARASSSESVSVRLGALEDVERSESEAIGLRVFVGQRSASINTSDFARDALEEIAARAVAMARAAPEDRYAGLAPQDLLATGDLPELDLEDSDDEPGPEALRERAIATETAALDVDGVTTSVSASATFARSVAALVTSHGVAAAYAATSHAQGAAMIAGEGADMQRDYEYRATRHFEDLPSPADIGAEAGQRTAAKRDPGRLPSGPMPVVFDPRVGSSLVSHLLGAMSGAAAARGTSLLLDRMDEPLFGPAIRIMDDPHRLRGHRSRPLDGEGLPTSKRALVEGGKVTGWLTNAAAAKQLGIGLTGHAALGSGGAPGISASNVYLEPGTISVRDLIADIERGVFVTELIGQGINMVTGDYSRGASGFRIENGEIAGPVTEFTIAGNLLTMFPALRAADDLEFKGGIDVPTLRVDGMTVAGE
ncbi:Metalloprotease PmbA like protein [Alteripontixanthobacter maritimus]|uniref:Metalloprotease PmbA like protein n=1 Tax=Alteripontixanthobacter maritimus TaxID=2161824 RepID=A0A369Q8C3_9SPHN|nr:TldD/PmbA family protein [Alteripontixanthobacter maritimus]RDC60964.1 Metalloprotease PmbA like protein [Alteripontixanthobacter maritimus]